ncbi:MAG: hypothetical protein QM739_02645 [Propionivibrio sp.]
MKQTAAVALCLALAGCAVPGPVVTQLPTRIDYVCAGNVKLPVARAPERGIAAVLLDDQEIPLRGGESAAQEKYTDGQYTLYLDGEKAFLEQNGKVVAGPCVSPAPLPTYFRAR